MKLFTKYQVLIPTMIGISLLFACTKQKTPTPVTPEPTKWEKIAGHYKVYDTTGIYLYDMDLVHIHNDIGNEDSIRFENFDGEFTFTSLQVYFSSIPMYVRIGGGDTLYDSNNKRWKLSAGTFTYYNNWKNDTIPLRFQKTNINYYIEDVTPYYACNCKQIAVKQH
ncbi:hypothetical protein D3C71_502780 [compost metagenome]